MPHKSRMPQTLAGLAGAVVIAAIGWVAGSSVLLQGGLFLSVIALFFTMVVAVLDYQKTIK